MSIVFKYCDDKGLPLIDLNDLKKVLQYVTDNPQGKAELSSNYGSIASSWGNFKIYCCFGTAGSFQFLWRTEF
jgi:hypothetical protein